MRAIWGRADFQRPPSLLVKRFVPSTNVHNFVGRHQNVSSSVDSQKSIKAAYHQTQRPYVNLSRPLQAQ